MANLLQQIFSIKNENIHKVITILGFRIKFKNYKKMNYCPTCKTWSDYADTKKYTKILCVNCKSLPRHRFLYFIYKKYFLNTQKPIKILHTAPERCIYYLIKKNSNIDYTPIDLYPEGYKFCNCIKEDVTNLSFSDNTFDFVLSNQVMEHILDEKRFLRELLRVIKPDGYLLLNFPVFIDLEKTFQDDSITSPEDREKYYGQYDHVRKYGRDIFLRLQKDYGAKIIFAKDLLSQKDITKMKLNPNDFCAVIPKGVKVND